MRRLGLLVLLGALPALSSCGHDASRRLENLSPEIRIIRGQIIDGDNLKQVAQIAWIGWDTDGFVDHYQFTSDVPDSLLGDIDKPSGGGIHWSDTESTNGTFYFQTAFPESVIAEDGQNQATGRYIGDHVFYVRSVDNEGLISRSDRISFRVSNVMPRTTVVTPKVRDIASVGAEVFVQWRGDDPDKPTPDRQPASYEYKMIRIPSVFASSDPQYAVDVTPGPLYPWVRVPPGATSVRLHLSPPESYWFVIRATDYLGAVENTFISGVNAFKMEASNRNYDRPRLLVKEKKFGNHLFPDDGLVVDLTIFQGDCLNFDYSADLSSYGGIFSGFNIGMDVADIDDTGPDSGFQGWSMISHPLKAICFDRPGAHTVAILARDTGGGTTLALYNVKVMPVPIKDREVLYIDDYSSRSVSGQADAVVDQRVHDMIVAAGYRDDDVYKLDPWGAGDVQGVVTQMTRADLGRYRLIIWNVEGAAGIIGNGRTALTYALDCTDKWLVRYLRTGGAVWIYGNHALAAPASTGCGATFANDATTGLDIPDGAPACYLMGLCGGDFHQVRTETSKKDGLVRALPTSIAQAELMPPLEADSSTYAYTILGGTRFIDAAFGPVNPKNGLETLYSMKAVQASSKFNDRYVAWRYHDPDPVPAMGPMALFFFNVNEMKQGSAAQRTGAHGLARALVAWFRQYLAPFGDVSKPDIADPD